MKILTFILTFVILSSCVDSKKPIHEQTNIELKLVDNIHIKKRLNETDSIRLNNEQTELFVKEWNNAKSEGLYKMGPEFWIIVKLKNDSIRKFRTNSNLIKEKNDWTYSLSDSTLISSFWKPEYPFAKPENYNPISFLEQVSSTLKTEKDTLRIGMTMIGDFPIDWVKEEHIEHLIKLLESKEICGCYLNPLSSYIPTDDFAEKGGYAGIFIKAYKEKRKVELGLYSCPKVDEKLNAELRKWWKERK
ncbi:hypothetical protein [Winogradskyella rapida]|uniref:Lipoprotein n=1 Tax=Winogradskyella rapida TaxID=549701 RepID=A0ABW3KS46_9FLAO